MTVIDRAHRNDKAAVARRQEAGAVLATVPAGHQRVLTAALRAPSAHNAQPWRVRPRSGGRYELHYDHHAHCTSIGSGRNAPRNHTVPSCIANPSRLWSPRRRPTSSAST